MPHKWVSCLESAYSTQASCLHQVRSKFIRTINFISMAVLAYMTLLGLHQCLKAQLIVAFIRDIFIIYKVNNIWIQHIFNHCFFGPFLIPFKGYFSISLLLPFFTYVKKHSLAFFIFQGRIYNIFQYKQYMSYQFQPTKSQVTRGSSAQCQTLGQPTRMIQPYNPTHQRQVLSPTQSRDKI